MKNFGLIMRTELNANVYNRDSNGKRVWYIRYEKFWTSCNNKIKRECVWCWLK